MNSQALAINSSSWIVGQTYTAAGTTQGFVWTPQTGMQGVGFLPGGSDSELQSVSNTNVAVGLASPAGASVGVPVIWNATNGLQALDSMIVNLPTTWTPNDAEAIAQTARSSRASVGPTRVPHHPPGRNMPSSLLAEP